MRDLTLGEVVDLHERLLEQSGGATGIRDLGLLESALAQPKATFDGKDLHPTLINVPLQPRWLSVAAAAVGCKRMKRMLAGCH